MKKTRPMARRRLGVQDRVFKRECAYLIIAMILWIGVVTLASIVINS